MRDKFKQRGGVGRRIVEMLELPGEVVFNLPVVQALGSEDVTVSNYKGLVEYNNDCVRISTTSGIIRLEGARLTLKYVTSESVSISGRVKKIEFIV